MSVTRPTFTIVTLCAACAGPVSAPVVPASAAVASTAAARAKRLTVTVLPLGLGNEPLYRGRTCPKQRRAGTRPARRLRIASCLALDGRRDLDLAGLDLRRDGVHLRDDRL